MTRLYRYLFALSPGAATLALSASVIQAITLTVAPILLGATIGHLTVGSPSATTIGWAAALIVSLLLAETGASLASMGAEFVVRGAERNLRLRTGYSFVKDPDLTTPESSESTSLATRINEGMWQFSNGCRVALTRLPSDALALIGATIALGVVLSWPFAIALFIAVIAQALILTRGAAANLARWGGDNEPLKHAMYTFDLTLGPAAKELRIFGLGGWLVDRYWTNYLLAYRPFWRRRWRYLAPQLGVALLRVGLMVAALAWAASRTDAGELPVSNFTAATALIVAFGALSVWGVSDIRSAATRLSWLETLSPSEDTHTIHRIEVGDLVAPPIEPGPAPAIVFDEVSFSYPGQDHLVLDRLTWELPAGQATALVGVNGAGKSTLVKLLTGGYRPTSGRLLVDGVDLASLDRDELAAWQRRLAPITQDFIRLPLSAGDNVELGSGRLWSEPAGTRDSTMRAPRDSTMRAPRDSTMRAPRDSAERAELDSLAVRSGLTDLIDQLPSGWDTILDKSFAGGTDLSGGEWQRIGLARALRAVDAGAGLLILDEPAAALDVESEARLVTSYLDLAARATSLLISHRFSVVRPVPAICVLSAGRITERGTHDELMAQQGEYARLFSLQADRYAVDTLDPLDAADEDVS